jgi:hypothetical protein
LGRRSRRRQRHREKDCREDPLSARETGGGTRRSSAWGVAAAVADGIPVARKPLHPISNFRLGHRL